MLNYTTPDAREELLSQVVERSATDADFRQQLLDDPRAAIFDGFGVNVPANYNIQFIERSPELDALVVLPDLVCEDGELSDDDLECVAGGTGDTW